VLVLMLTENQQSKFPILGDHSERRRNGKLKREAISSF